MNFIYDILLNFNDQFLYEFYEWQLDDDIEHIKRIPLFKVNDITFYQLKKNNIIIEAKFLNNLYQQTEIIDKKSIRKVDYACLFTNLKEVLAIVFSSHGQSLMKSNLLLDEASEVIVKGNPLKLSSLNYKVVHQSLKNQFLTRRELEVISFLNREIKNLYQTKMVDKLKYLYFEYFNLVNDDFNFIYQQLKKIINQEWTNKHEELYQLIKLSYNKKSN